MVKRQETSRESEAPQPQNWSGVADDGEVLQMFPEGECSTKRSLFLRTD